MIMDYYVVVIFYVNFGMSLVSYLNFRLWINVFLVEFFTNLSLAFR